jgi:hypothetical protein
MMYYNVIKGPYPVFLYLFAYAINLVAMNPPLDSTRPLAGRALSPRIDPDPAGPPAHFLSALILIPEVSIRNRF